MDTIHEKIDAVKRWWYSDELQQSLRQSRRQVARTLSDKIEDGFANHRSFFLANVIAISGLLAFYASTIVISYLLFLVIAFALIERERTRQFVSSALTIFDKNADLAGVDCGFMKGWTRSIATFFKRPETVQERVTFSGISLGVFFFGYMVFKTLKFIHSILCWINFLLKVVPCGIFLATLMFVAAKCYRKRKMLIEERLLQGEEHDAEMTAARMPADKPKFCTICETRAFYFIFGYEAYRCERCFKQEFCKYCCPRRLYSRMMNGPQPRICENCWTATGDQEQEPENDESMFKQGPVIVPREEPEFLSNDEQLFKRTVNLTSEEEEPEMVDEPGSDETMVNVTVKAPKVD